MLMIPDDVEGALAYQTTLNGPYEVEPEFMQAWAEGVVENYAWLTDELGFELGDATAGRPEFPGTEGGESIKTYYVDGICGMSSLWIPLVDKADELGVSFEYNARAVELAHEWETKEVRGGAHGGRPRVQGPQGRGHGVRGLRVEPRHDAELHGQHGLPQRLPARVALQRGRRREDGPAHRSGPLAHEQLRRSQHLRARDQPRTSPIGSIFYAKGYDYIYVNSEGERFMYEETRSVQRHGKQKDKGVWPLLDIPSPSYMIMGGQSGSVDILGDITYMSWPVIMELGCQTNQELIDAGIMFKADTIEELAGKLGFEPEVLAATLKKYNDSVDSGEEDEFGRGTAVYSSYLFNAAKGTDDISGDEHGGESLAIEPFERVRIEGPFYGVEIALGMLNSQGGAKRNGQSQVLDLDGNPIPRLYSAGEFGSIYAYMYNGGGNVSEAVSTGRVAGQGAAALDPWDAE